MTGLSAEQQAMERRYGVPVSWCKGPHTRHTRQKEGLWRVASLAAGDLRGKKVLDAGCGDGWYSAKMMQAGAIVRGADYSERAVRFAQAIVGGAEFEVASITALPYADATFDLTFSFQVLEHIPPADLPLAIKELARVTKPGGNVIATVPSTNRKMSKAHYQHFTPASVMATFEPYARVDRVVGQGHRTWILWIVERLLQNRFYTLESLGAWFNRTVYLRNYNETSPEEGENLVVLIKPRARL